MAERSERSLHLHRFQGPSSPALVGVGSHSLFVPLGLRGEPGLDGWVSGGSIAERRRRPWQKRRRDTPAPNLPFTAKLTHTCYKKGLEKHMDDISGLYYIGMGASRGGDPTLMDGVETRNVPGPDSFVRQQLRRSRALTGRSRLVSRVLSLERGASVSMRRFERPVGRFDRGKGVCGPAVAAGADAGEAGPTLRIERQCRYPQAVSGALRASWSGKFVLPRLRTGNSAGLGHFPARNVNKNRSPQCRKRLPLP